MSDDTPIETKEDPKEEEMVPNEGNLDAVEEFVDEPMFVEERTYVVECLIMGISLLLPLPLNVNVDTVAREAYAEFKAMNPRAPPLKITCVRDKNNKILSKGLKLKDHHLDRHFVVQVEEYNAADLLNSPEGVTNEYRRWQMWTVDQIYDMIKVSLASKAEDDNASVLAKTEDIRKSKDYDNKLHLDDGLGKEWAPAFQIEQDVDEKWITLLNELSYTPHEGVKCSCLEVLNLLRLRSSSIEVVKGAALRICQILVDENDSLNVVVCAFNSFRTNAKGLLPLSSYHQKEIILLNTSIVKQYMDILSRFPSSEDQRIIMSAYKSMYIHRYGIDTGVGKSHGIHDMHSVDHKRAEAAQKGGDMGKSMDLSESMSFEPSDLHHAEETVIRLRTLLSSDETSVWKFAVTKLHTLLNELRNPLDRRSCFDEEVEGNLASLFQSNQEIRFLTACLLNCLKASIDTKSAKFKQARRKGDDMLEGGTGEDAKEGRRRKRQGNSGRSGSGSKGGKAKQLIDAALLSPETDIVMVKKVIDCLYLLTLPFSFDVGVEDNVESAKLNSLQVNMSKACLEEEARWRLLLTLTYAQNLVISGRCAFLFRLIVLVHGRENTEGNHWENFKSIIDPAAFVQILHNDASQAADFKVVKYNDALNNTGFGSNESVDIDSVEVLEAHAGLLVMDYASHFLNSKQQQAPSDSVTEANSRRKGGGGGSTHSSPEGKSNYYEDGKHKGEGDEEEEEDEPENVETARGKRGMQVFEKVLSKTSPGKGASHGHKRSGLSTLRMPNNANQSGLEYVAKIENRTVSTIDKYVLEDVFMANNNKLFLKVWRLANYTEVPSSEKGGRDALRMACHYLQRKMALDILSQLVAMSSVFKDQLIRIAGIAKVIAMVGDKSILRQKLDRFRLKKLYVSPRTGMEGDGEEEGKKESTLPDPELTSALSTGNMNDTDALLAFTVDIEAVRYALKILVTLAVAQESSKQKTIVRIIKELEVGGVGSGIKLAHVAQTDRQTAFFYATLLTLGSQY